jgi:hypothetical protein
MSSIRPVFDPEAQTRKGAHGGAQGRRRAEWQANDSKQRVSTPVGSPMTRHGGASTPTLGKDLWLLFTQESDPGSHNVLRLP